MGMSMVISQTSDEEVSLQAAEWVVRLTADHEEERAAARAGFEAWKQEDARHTRAAQQIEGFLARVHKLRDDGDGPVRAALNSTRPRAKPRRAKTAAVTLALVVLLGLPSWGLLQSHAPSYLMADLRTSTGEWKSTDLQDGSRLTLNSASAVNMRFSDGRRTIELVAGEVLVDVAHDPGRPFWVETPHGGVRALGTRFVVQREDDATVLTMLASRALAQPAHGTQGASPSDPRNVVVGPGQRVRITPDQVEVLTSVDPASVDEAWTRHQLVADNRPLPEVLDELDRHRPGTISYDRSQLAGIRVSAVLPLDDTDRALQLLLTSLPTLRVRTLTDYFVMVDAPGVR